MPASGATEQEDKLKTIFVNLEMLFKKLEKAKDGEKLKAILKEITDNLKEAKT